MKKFALSIKPIPSKESENKSMESQSPFSASMNISNSNSRQYECNTIPNECEEYGHGANGRYFRCKNSRIGIKVSYQHMELSKKRQYHEWKSLIEYHNELRSSVDMSDINGTSIGQFFVLPKDDMKICRVNENRYKLLYSMDHIEGGKDMSEFLKTDAGKDKIVLRELYIQLLFAFVWLHDTDCSTKQKYTHNDLRKPNVLVVKTTSPISLEGQCILEKVKKIDPTIMDSEWKMKTGYMIKIIDWELLRKGTPVGVTNACMENDDGDDKECAENLVSEKKRGGRTRTRI